MLIVPKVILAYWWTNEPNSYFEDVLRCCWDNLTDKQKLNSGDLIVIQLIRKSWSLKHTVTFQLKHKVAITITVLTWLALDKNGNNYKLDLTPYP